MASRNLNDPFFPDGLPDAGARAAGPANVPAVRGAERVRRLPRAPAPLPDLPALQRALSRHWLLALSLGGVSALLAGATAWRVAPRPMFTASVVIEVKTQKPILLNEAGQEKTDYKVFQATQLALVKSRLVLSSALGRTGVASLPSVRVQPEPADWLDDQVYAEFYAGSELMRLTMTGDRPRDLALLVNAVADAYLDEILTKDHSDRDSKAARYKGLLDEYNGKLTRQRAALRKLAETVGSDDRQTLALKQQLAVQQFAAEKAELQKVCQELKRAGVELAVLRASDPRHSPRRLDPAAVEAALARDPAVERHRVQVEALADKLDRARRLVRNDGDPALRELRGKYDAAGRALGARRAELRPAVERQLRAEAGGEPADRAADLENQIKVLAGYEIVLREGIDTLDKEARSFNLQTIDLQSMKDEIAAGEEISRQIGRQLEGLNVELKAPQRGRIVERAERPRMESARKRLASIALAAVGAFACSVFAVSYREIRLRKVDSPVEVVDLLGLQLVGTLPASPGPARHVGVEAGAGGGAYPARWQSLLVESIDAARTVLLRDCRAGEVRAVMVTSASKGEGKSSLSGHLAISLARTGRRTLLADFDLRRPSAHRLFDLPPAPGICELLRGEVGLEATAVNVMACLDVIPAGRRDPEAVRSLGRDGLAGLVARMKADYDFVVFDSAPVLPVADSLLLAQHVDAVLISVYRGVSRMPDVFAGHERLASLGVRVLGVVVTGVPAESYGEAYHYPAAAVV